MRRPIKVHELKTWPTEFFAIELGRKTFEVRRNDRDFQEDDIVLLREWVPAHEAHTMGPYDSEIGAEGYSGRTLGPFKIGYLITGRIEGDPEPDVSPLPDGWCGFALIKLVRESL